ncbi:hypothetical protein GDO86_019351 [Hymenochirus boettgeri]|uniref:Actin filament-associated protein 1-like 2 n=1 Tax=Hymenochirus boettgeri TaxID=247094 RepID=A0A8T2IJ35_9PIPI|nr:hypothetical protein GDO86_019351 [Hymenochirus boettgeri]
MDRLLTELEDFLSILDKENLSSSAILKKSTLSEILQMYIKTSSSCDEEYIYMNKVVNSDAPGKRGIAEMSSDLPAKETLTNGTMGPGQHLAPPQKSLPDLPPLKQNPERIPVCKYDSTERYYEEAEPFDPSVNDDGDASTSYESYDEEETNKGKPEAQQHQWPSTEASIELMKDALICAFLWRKKWLGQWAKQLCIIKDNRLLCYKTSKDHSPHLDVSLIGCSVSYKEKHDRRKEHKLKILPNNADVIVLGMQSKDQAEQWLKVINDISGFQADQTCDGSLTSADGQRFIQTKLEGTDRYSAASESGSSTDGHSEPSEVKEVKKKGSSGIRLSNLIKLGRNKSTCMESPDKTLETSNYLNVLINSQWKSRYCCVKEGQLHFYQDRNKTKSASQPLCLAGCEIFPQPCPDRLYSIRILHHEKELATLEAKSSEDMGHWLGLLLSESGSKTDPEDFAYDYVDSDRVSCIVSAAKNSYFLMQRKYSEPNTYIDTPRGGRYQLDDVYDDVDVSDIPEEEPSSEGTGHAQDKTYLEILPVKSALYSLAETKTGHVNIKKDKEESENSTLPGKQQDISVQAYSTTQQMTEDPPAHVPCNPQTKGVRATASPQQEKSAKDRVKGPNFAHTHVPDCSPVNAAMALKNRPLSIMTTGKGTVLQKAKEWEKKGAS